MSRSSIGMPSSGELHHRAAGDPFQDVAGDGSGDERTVAHQKEVAATSLGDVRAGRAGWPRRPLSPRPRLWPAQVDVGAGELAPARYGVVGNSVPGGDRGFHAGDGVEVIAELEHVDRQLVVEPVEARRELHGGLVDEGADVDVSGRHSSRRDRRSSGRGSPG